MTSSEEEPVLSWPECARLCKSVEPLSLTRLTFQWGPTNHVLRRFLQTNALPKLEILNVRLPSCDGGAIALFRSLAECGRPLKCMTITIAINLQRTRMLRFTLYHDHVGREVVHYESLFEPVSDSDVLYVVASLHLPTPVSSQ